MADNDSLPRRSTLSPILPRPPWTGEPESTGDGGNACRLRSIAVSRGGEADAAADKLTRALALPLPPAALAPAT